MATSSTVEKPTGKETGIQAELTVLSEMDYDSFIYSLKNLTWEPSLVSLDLMTKVIKTMLERNETLEERLRTCKGRPSTRLSSMTVDCGCVLHGQWWWLVDWLLEVRVAVSEAQDAALLLHCPSTPTLLSGWLPVTPDQADYCVYFGIDRNLANFWTDPRSTVLMAATQCWRGEPNFTSGVDEPLGLLVINLTKEHAKETRQFNRLYYSHCFLNAKGEGR